MMMNAGSLIDIFKLFCIAGLKSVFPNLYILVKISVTIPVTSVTIERKFHKMKLVKTRLRTTTGAKRFEGLMVIACENDIEMDTDKIIDDFASRSPMLTKCLVY